MKKKRTRYKKLVIDNKLMRVFLVSYDKKGEMILPVDIQRIKNLKGIALVDATQKEFLADYIKRYGQPVDVG